MKLRKIICYTIFKTCYIYIYQGQSSFSLFYIRFINDDYIYIYIYIHTPMHIHTQNIIKCKTYKIIIFNR